MRQALLALRALGLAPIVGGAVILGALVAPAIFKNAFLDRHDAGVIMAGIFGRFEKIAMGGAAIWALCEVIVIARFGKPAPLDAIRITLGAIAMGLLAYQLFSLTPTIRAAQALAQSAGGPGSPAFEVLHKRSESIYKVLLFAAAGAMALLR